MSQIQVFPRGHRPSKSDVKIPVKVNDNILSVNAPPMWRDRFNSQ